MTFIGVGIPAVVLGIFLQLIFALKLGWFPFVANKVYPWDDLGEHVKNFLLPTLWLAIPIAAVYGRLLRSDMVQTLQSDFVTLAGEGCATGACAVAPRTAQLVAVAAHCGRHPDGCTARRCARRRDPLRPRWSRQLAGGVGARLRPVHRAELLAIIVLLVVVVNFTVDISYALVDPRIRQARTLV